MGSEYSFTFFLFLVISIVFIYCPLKVIQKAKGRRKADVSMSQTPPIMTRRHGNKLAKTRSSFSSNTSAASLVSTCVGHQGFYRGGVRRIMRATSTGGVLFTCHYCLCFCRFFRDGLKWQQWDQQLGQKRQHLRTKSNKTNYISRTGTSIKNIIEKSHFLPSNSVQKVKLIDYRT